MRNGFITALVIFLIVVLLGVAIDLLGPSYGFFGRVPTGHVGILTRFGEVREEGLSEGFTTKGFFDKITNMDTRIKKYVLKLSAFSKDIQEVNIDIAVNYNVDKDSAATLFRTIGTDYETKVIEPAVLNQTKVAFRLYNAEGLVAHRDELAKNVKSLLIAELAPYGINIASVSIEDIDFTDAFTNAVEQKQVATQNKLAEQTEQEKLTAITEAEADRKKIEAEAAAEVKKTQADAEAYAIRVKAEAEAEANRALAASITEELINYLYAQGWDGQLPDTVLGGHANVVSILGQD